MRYMRYTAYVCMFGRRGKGAEISLMGVRFFEIAIPLCSVLPNPDHRTLLESMIKQTRFSALQPFQPGSCLELLAGGEAAAR